MLTATDAPPARHPDPVGEAPQQAAPYLQEVTAKLPPEFTAVAPIWLLDRATTELPNALRVQAVRSMMFMGAIAMADSDQRRTSAIEGMGLAQQGFELISSAFSTPDLVLRDFPTSVALIDAVAPARKGDINSLRQHSALIRDALTTGERETITPEIYNKLLDSTYDIVAPALSRLRDDLSREVVAKQDAAAETAQTARTDALDACAEISQIAKTVQLISLNARVEAARAGASGVAFGVIAGEIKDLSEKAGVTSQRVSAAVETIMEQITG